MSTNPPASWNRLTRHVIKNNEATLNFHTSGLRHKGQGEGHAGLGSGIRGFRAGLGSYSHVTCRDISRSTAFHVCRFKVRLPPSFFSLCHHPRFYRWPQMLSSSHSYLIYSHVGSARVTSWQGREFARDPISHVRGSVTRSHRGFHRLCGQYGLCLIFVTASVIPWTSVKGNGANIDHILHQLLLHASFYGMNTLCVGTIEYTLLFLCRLCPLALQGIGKTKNRRHIAVKLLARRSG